MERKLYVSRAFILATGAVAASVIGFAVSTVNVKNVVKDSVARSADRTLDAAEAGVGALRSFLSLETDDATAKQLADAVRSSLMRDGAPVSASADAPDFVEVCEGPGGVQSDAMIGDRIALRFFEWTDAAQGEIAFERLDLGGVYEVEATGQISVPLVGRVVVAGRPLVCAEALVANRYAAALGGRASVAAAYSERPAATVYGAVRAPGAYRVDPGATVARLLALAGALSPGSGVEDPALANLRGRDTELERLETGARLALKAREAAARRATALDLDPAERAAFAAALDPARIEAEERALAETVANVARRISEAQERAGAQRARIALLRSERAALAAQIADKNRRLAELRGFQERGVASLSRLTADEAGLTTLERAAFALALEQEAAGAALAEAERAASSIVGEHGEAMAVAMRSLAESIDALRAQRLSIARQIAALGAPGDDSSAEGQTVTILRQTAKGPVQILAGPDMYVLPGDVVRVGAVASRLAHLE